MKKRTVWWIVATAILAHVGLFLWLGQMRPMPKAQYVPPPNFGFKETVRTNTVTGERTVEREYNVSTRLVSPEELAEMQKNARPREVAKK